MNLLAKLCRAVIEHTHENIHGLSQDIGVSLDAMGPLIEEALEKGYISQELHDSVSHDNKEHNSQSIGNYCITDAGLEWLEQFKVQSAIILAAGLGTRMVPFTYSTPKGLLFVKGQRMIERQIEHLLEVGIPEIVLVVGYLAEKFEYLIDAYGVKLIYNPEYDTKGNLTSLYLAREHLSNSYILAADHWSEHNIFHTYEADTWQCCIFLERKSDKWSAIPGSHNIIESVEYGTDNGWAMVGPAHFTHEFSRKYLAYLEDYIDRPGTKDYFWEHILKEHIQELPLYLNRQDAAEVYEFETIDDLRTYDPSYLKGTNIEVVKAIANAFDVPSSAISNVRAMTEGMTNFSFIFDLEGESYVYRIPGTGTDRLISRKNEKRSYELMKPLDITDELMYFDENSGVKITRFYQARVGDPYDDTELEIMMQLLKRIHASHIKAEYRFDIKERIEYYEQLAKERDSILFEDYEEVRSWADELIRFKERLAIPEQLCHIDYIYANILFLENKDIRVIDWEYAGNADPLIDVAMFSLYTQYDKEQMDRALYLYLGKTPTRLEEARLYMYVALGGFLWSIWTEYKQGLGDDFGSYALDMYRYMKDYYRLLKKGAYLEDTMTDSDIVDSTVKTEA